jgi:Sulfotransferase domain
MRVLAHIGYHKTGSSWLQHFVFEDPASGYASVGHQSPDHPLRRIVAEHPFRYEAARVRADLEAMIAQVESRGLFPVVSLERLSGNPFTGGHDSRQIADRLHDALLDPGVLVVIREQRSVIVAVYKQYVKGGGTASISQFLEPVHDRARRANLFDPAFFEYEHLLGHYRSLFGPENVLVLAYDEFARDGRSFVQRIGAFTGRPFPEGLLARLPYGTRENRSISALSISALRQVNRLAPRTELNPGPAVESRAASWLSKQLKKNNVLERQFIRPLAAGADDKLHRIVEQKIGRRYAESNRATAELTGLDLAAYGWPV